MIRHTTNALFILSTLVGNGLTFAFTSNVLHNKRYATSNIQSVSNTANSQTSLEKDIFTPSEIDAGNTPPSLLTILNSLSELKSGSDLRGTYKTLQNGNTGGTIMNISHLIKQFKESTGGVALTPFASYCFGVGFANWLLQKNISGVDGSGDLTICIGRDPRVHGERLADSFARGAESVSGVSVLYTGITNTPSMYEYVKSSKCEAAIQITASHLPEDRNGMKFFAKGVGGLSALDIDELIVLAQNEARSWYDMGLLPPSSGNSGVLCSKLVDFLPYYKDTLRQAIIREVGGKDDKPLAGLSIVVNPGKGSGYFFNDILDELGANVESSIHLIPDGSFPESFGVPNPEKKEMVDETRRVCEATNTDIGVMFDTDADRAGFVLPRDIGKDGKRSNYEPLSGNRLIALLGVMFSTSSPECTFVTDSTTSEGLNKFLESTLGLKHYRYLRGYANVISKAEELTASGEANAEVAIETSGHCAMQENGYVDDGTYTAVKIIGLLARAKASGKGSLLDLISDLDEMPHVEEFRLQATDGSLETTTNIFQQASQSLKELCNDSKDWTFDEDNKEGVRARLSSGGFFMIRQSLHDPVISLQVESISEDVARGQVLEPLLDIFSKYAALDYSSLQK